MFTNASLISAVEQGNVERVRSLILEGANIDAKKDEPAERTPLMLAIKHNDLKVIDLLLESGADINAKNSFKAGELTVLMIAIMIAGVNDEVCMRLISKGPEVNAVNRTGTTALMLAAATGRSSLLRPLIELGGNVSTIDTLGRSAFLMCHKIDDFDMMALLGADIHAVNNKGLSALMINATGIAKSKVIHHLINMGLDINGKDVLGSTALMRSAITNNLEVVSALLEAGADVDIVNDDGNSVFDLSYGQTSESLISAFIENRQIIKNVGESQTNITIKQNRMRTL